jgi:hypothetical protein
MPTTLKRNLRRLILQSEADLLAHAQLRFRVHEADESLGADCQNPDVSGCCADRSSSTTLGLAPTSTEQES